MKRTLRLVLFTLIIVATIGPATAKVRWLWHAKKPVVVEQEVTAEPGQVIPAPQIKRDRKTTTGDGGDPVSKPGPAPFGPPVELAMKRAGGRKFDLRSLPQTSPERFERPEREEPEIIPTMLGTALTVPPINIPSVPTRNAPAPPTIMNFDGLDFATWGAGHPPDTNGDVGPTYYIQTINTSIGIFRKSDGVRVAAFTFNTFMSQGHFGNLCDTNNFGDPVVLYDSFEDRWIITDFAFTLTGGGAVINPPGNFQCIAASMSGDPVSGGWNFYSINTAGGLGDYPKLGIWPDGLYMSVNMFGYPSGAPFQNPRVFAFNKAQMYAGTPSVQVVTFDAPSADFAVMPSNARLQAGTPPPGSPNYFISTWEFLNALTVYKFHVNWNAISTSTFTGPDTPLAATSWPNATVPNALSQGGNALDVLQIRAMVQNQYTNLGGAESLWIAHTVRRGDTSGLAAPRWYQVDVTGGTVNPNIPQATTWDPDGANVISRFMPSVAIDRAGNMAMGYSTSSSTTFPAIKYAGRLATDPINTFSQTEQLLMQGTGTQTGNCGASACIRWGDYSGMTLDPADGCTFWATNLYYAVNGLAFLTRIGTFSYPSCTPVGAGGTVSGTVTAAAGGAPINGATVQMGARSTTTDPSGFYSFTSIPAGTYPTLTASFPGFITGTASNIVVTDGNTTTDNFSLASAPASACPTDTTQADFQTGILTNVDVTTSPGDVILFKPSIDQQNPTLSSSGVGITITTWGGQTFTPAVTGKLTRVDLNLFCSGCTGTTPNLTLSIRATAGGLPTGADLVAGTITGFSNGGVASNFTVLFGSPITLNAGTLYAIAIRPVANPAPGTYALTRSANDVYPGGTRVAGATSGTVWSIPLTAGSSTDAGFITYMDSGFAPSGNLVSSTKDSNPLAGLTPIWSTLSWTATTPPNTSIRFQVAGSNSTSGPFNFVGPDGTASTFFTTSGASLAQFYNLRYLQYTAYLATTDSTQTPTLSDVSLCFVDTDCTGPITITPTPAQVCANVAGNTASGPAGEASYSWGITNGTIVGSTTSQTVTYTAGASGFVGLTLSVVETGGCRKSTLQNVTINANPTSPTITISNVQTVTVTGGAGAFVLTFSGQDTPPLAFNATDAAVQGALNSLSTIGGVGGSVTVTSIAGVYTVTFGGTLTGPQPQLVAAGSGGATATVNASPVCSTSLGNQASGPAGATTYAWSITNGAIIGATDNQTITYTAGASGTVILDLTVTNAATCSAVSDPANVPINPLPAAPTITPGGPTTFCAGGSVTLTSSVASGNQWSLNGNPIGGATNTTYAATASGNYTVTTTDGNGCTSVPSTATTVTVNPLPATPTITPGGPTTFCTGGSVTLTSSSASGNQWFLNGNPIGGATNTTYLVTASGNYTVTTTDGNGCTSATSATTVVTVNPIPATPTVTPGGPTTFCAGGSVTLTSSSASGNQWFLNGNPIGGATSQTYIATAAGDYTVTVTTTGCTSAPSATTTVTVNPNPDATITASASVVHGSTGNIASVANAGVGATYAWGITNGTITAGAGTSSITYTAGGVGTLTLNVTVTTSAGCSDAKSANVNVGVPTVTVTSVSPNHGTGTGDTLVTINGTNFATGATVTFGGNAATSVVVVSAIKITARTPVHAVGSVNVTVTNTDTSTGTLTNGYLYTAQVFDPNNDNTITSADIFFLVNYLFLGGPAPHGPDGTLSGDANGDGLVDSADIFYVVNYLFLGGQKPNLPSATTGPTHATAIGAGSPQMAGSLALGKAVLRDGRYVVPVIMTAAPGSMVPQAMSLRVHFESNAALGQVAVRRAGAAKDTGVAFEINRQMGNDLTYLVLYDPSRGGLALGESRSAVVAEIEIAAAGANIAISIDPLLTMLTDQTGTTMATVANGKLVVSGTSIGSGASPRPRTPGHEVN